MATVIIGLVSALIYGTSDFLGGLASQRISPIRVTAVSALSGLACLSVALFATGGEVSPSAVALGALAGIAGAVAIGLLYACLAIGPMSILSPLTAVVSAIVPVSVSLVGGDRLAPLGYLAIGIALVAVVLVGFVPERGAVRPSLRGIVMAIGSGAAIGAFLIIIDQTPADSGLVPLVAGRLVTGTVMFALIGVLALRDARAARVPGAAPRTRPGWRPGIALALVCGVADALANAGLLLGVRIGELSVVAVLTALYPAGTIILAAIVLKERIAVVQYLGLALAITAAALLAIA